MQAGRLDRRIDIESKLTGQDAYGEEIVEWAKIGERVPASAVPVSGDEKFAASQFVGHRVIEFRIRWAQRFADLSPLDRIVYPSQYGDSPTEDPAAQHVFDIQDVREIGRREGLQIFAVSRSEVSNA